MLRKWLGLTGVAALASVALAGGADAADLYTPPPVYEPAPVYVFNWTGFYAGAHVGYGWGDADVVSEGHLVDFSQDIDGWFVGGQVGYNYQFASNIVLGIEADASWADIDGSESEITGGFGDTTVEHEIDWFGSVRGRLGYAMDTFLPYVTGGFAWARAERSSDWDGFGGGSASEKKTHTGWVIGGGVEWAFMENASAKLEYQYMDLGSKTYDLDFGIAVPVPRVDLELHTVRLGVNFLF